MQNFKFDEIGNWSEIKLTILEKYAAAYSRIMSAPNQQALNFKHSYIDGFSGAGLHLSKETGEPIAGSPLRLLSLDNPFAHYYFVDLNSQKLDFLRSMVGKRGDVSIIEGDCNEALTRDVFPKIRYSKMERALCFLDPYGLHLKWETIVAAAQSKAIEIFLNFPIMDMNMNAIRGDKDQTPEWGKARMDAFWGDSSWTTAAYETEDTLFGPQETKLTNEHVALAFRKRLKDTAGFAYVPEPIPMKNEKNATVYYLYFASQNKTGAGIVTSILKEFRKNR